MTILESVSLSSGGGYTQEEIEDIVAALLVAGTNITLTYNDGAGTLTIDSSGAGGTTSMARTFLMGET